MKNSIILLLLLISINSYCPPPKPPTNHGSNKTVGQTPINASTPIGTGTGFLITIATIYTGFMMYKLRTKKDEDIPKD